MRAAQNLRDIEIQKGEALPQFLEFGLDPQIGCLPQAVDLLFQFTAAFRGRVGKLRQGRPLLFRAGHLVAGRDEAFEGGQVESHEHGQQQPTPADRAVVLFDAGLQKFGKRVLRHGLQL